MGRYLPFTFPDLPPLTITAAFDIILVAVFIYQFLLIIRGRRAVHVLLGMCVLGLIYAAAVWAKLELLHTILATLVPYTPIALIVMFQAELRRALARLGRRPFLGISQLERRELSQEVVLAVGRLSQTNVGALIVIERKIGLRTFRFPATCYVPFFILAARCTMARSLSRATGLPPRRASCR
jgi:diadenylate cyclase